MKTLKLNMGILMIFISGFTMFPDTNTKHYIFFIVTGIFEFILGYIWIKRWINENMGETA